jgi:uncharacterized protein with NRDE domain
MGQLAIFTVLKNSNWERERERERGERKTQITKQKETNFKKYNDPTSQKQWQFDETNFV